MRLWLVDMPLAEHAPSRSRRAAFLHRAPHVTNNLTCLWVHISFLLKINFLIFSISEYWISFFRGYCHTQLPSLLRHYSLSSVIWSCPTACYPSSFLARLYAVLLRSYSLRWLGRDNRLSPVDCTFTMWSMIGTNAPWDAHLLTKSAVRLLSSTCGLCRLPRRCRFRGRICHVTLLPHCLRLAGTVTNCPPKTRYRWLVKS